jgi:hypothetical protein
MASPPTSVSDSDSYRAICARAAGDDEVFAEFRRQPEFLAIVEPPSVDPDGWRAGRGDVSIDAAEYAAHVRAITAYRPLLDAFRASDRIGAPVVESFAELGDFNRYTLRYIKILWDLELLFKSLAGLRILEIGGGYGGQCAIIARRFDVASYDILDLPETAALARRFLATAGIAQARCLSDISALQPSYDLLISNYAFSELSDALRVGYRETLVPRCARGFMMWNRVYFDITTLRLGRDEAVARFRAEMDALAQHAPNLRTVDELLTEDDRARAVVMLTWP